MTDNSTCGFCDKEFEYVDAKIIHQNKFCNEMPRTITEEPE